MVILMGFNGNLMGFNGINGIFWVSYNDLTVTEAWNHS